MARLRVLARWLGPLVPKLRRASLGVSPAPDKRGEGPVVTQLEVPPEQHPKRRLITGSCLQNETKYRIKKLVVAATMIRPRYLPDSIIAQLVSVSAFSHSLGPEQTPLGLAPTEERRLSTAHTQLRHYAAECLSTMST